jgi:multidrug resistance protein
MARHLDEESPLLERDSEDEERSHHHLDFDQDDERNPRAWPRSKKLCNVAIIACMSILSPLTSSIFTPGIHQIADGLHTTPDRIIATTTGFLIMLGLGPLVLAPLSETFGRRIVYVSCFSVFTLLHIPAALSPNVAFLIAIRTISGFFRSVGIANGGGTINDMFEPSGRASVYGWYLLGPVLGPVLGPLLGGFIVERLGWLWIYWVLTFICSCNTLAGYLFLKESYAPILLARQKKKLEQECGSRATYSYEGQDQRPLSHKVLTSFRRPVVIFYQPIVLILSTFQALVFSTTYTIYTQMQVIFASGPYCFSTQQVGYLYLSIGLGSLTSVWFLVPQIDNVYDKLADRNKGVALPEYRLPLTNIGSVLVPLSLIWFAWTVSYRLHWFIPILALYFYGVGQVMIINTVQNYFIDSFSRYAASAIAAGSAMRSVFGGLTPLLASQMFQHIGYGWGTSVLAMLAVLIAPGPVILYFYGKRLREKFPVSF